VSEREDSKEEKEDEKIEDLDLDLEESGEGREITERVHGGRAPISHDG
jgi:hypothetical protein